MKMVYGIFAMLVVVLFVSACTQSGPASADNGPAPNDVQQEQNNPEVSQEQEQDVKVQVQTSGSIPMTEIYNYASVKKFTYDTTTTVNGETFKSTMDYSLSSDTVNGRAAWLSEANVETQGATMMTKVWSDKVTYGCLKMTSVVIFNGQEMETPSECPKEGPNAQTTATETPMVDYLGEETVTVPLGTFDTKKYSLEGKITYYYASSVPIPVKVTYDGAGTVTELVSWS
ncbi:MAG: hypothetical protein ACP5NV_00370 [Candidatus Woesearchaeota archaeon]